MENLIGKTIRFGNNRIPYMFPVTLNGNFQHMVLDRFLEFKGEVTNQDDRFIYINMQDLEDGVNSLSIEWALECFKLIKVLE